MLDGFTRLPTAPIRTDAHSLAFARNPGVKNQIIIDRIENPITNHCRSLTTANRRQYSKASSIGVREWVCYRIVTALASFQPRGSRVCLPKTTRQLSLRRTLHASIPTRGILLPDDY